MPAVELHYQAAAGNKLGLCREDLTTLLCNRLLRILSVHRANYHITAAVRLVKRSIFFWGCRVESFVGPSVAWKYQGTNDLACVHGNPATLNHGAVSCYRMLNHK